MQLLQSRRRRGQRHRLIEEGASGREVRGKERHPLAQDGPEALAEAEPFGSGRPADRVGSDAESSVDDP